MERYLTETESDGEYKILQFLPVQEIRVILVMGTPVQ